MVHDDPEAYLQTLITRFPGCNFHAAGSDEELRNKINSLQPEILLSFRCDAISPQAQSNAARANCIQWIQVAGAGHDHLGDLSELSCTVTNCGGVLSRFQAETVIGAMINLNFGFHRYLQQQAQKVYQKIPWKSLADQRLLLIGFGHIGKAVAANARHFGMHVTAIRTKAHPTPEADAVYTMEELPEQLPHADFVSLHLPHTKTTHHFFSKELFSTMKADSFFINTARGQLVDESALIEALQNRQIGGAYLDVFETEPLPKSSPLWDLDNVLLTPHYCDAVSDWHKRFADFFASNLQNWLAHSPLINRIDQ